MGEAGQMKARAVVVVGVLVGAVVVTLDPAGPAMACSCAVFTMESEVADADAAFVGVATEALNVPLGPGVTDEFGGGPGSWAFDVVEVVKGDVGDRVEVWQAMAGECGPIFEIGELIGVVVRRDGDRFVTDNCGGVWLPEELLAPGTLAAPTGSGPAVLVASGRTGDAMLATYDVEGNLVGWGLGEPEGELLRPRVCPGSTTVVGMTRSWSDDTVALERWDLATLRPVSSVTLPYRSQALFWPFWTDNLGFRCTSADGDVALLLAASPNTEYADDNVVVWVHGNETTMHPIGDAWNFAVAPDLASGYLIVGEHGTAIETIVLADGTQQPFAELPDGLGGRALAVDTVTGRVAVFASSDATSEPYDPPGIDRLAILDSGGGVLAVSPLELTGLGTPGAVQWLDGDRLIAFWALTSARVDVIRLDGSLESSFELEAFTAWPGLAVLGDRLYLATDDGVLSTALDGNDARLLQPGIARVVEVVATPDPISD
jgi:hypothetical protein